MQREKALANAYPARDDPTSSGSKPRVPFPSAGRTCRPIPAAGTPTANSGAPPSTRGTRHEPQAPRAAAAAAALATGMSPLGLGNDTLGSLRWPAQCSGVTALEPILGRIPHATTIEPLGFPIGPQLAGVEGPLARRVADLLAPLEIMAGPSWRDPWTVPAPPHGPELPKPIRVAVVLDPAGQGIAKQVQEASARRPCFGGRRLPDRRDRATRHPPRGQDAARCGRRASS
jgi:amidase